MTWLLDVSVIVARLMNDHVHHSRVIAWFPGRQIATCPITEIGYLRVACASNFSMAEARRTLAEFLRDTAPLFIPCDRHALDGHVAHTGKQTTDIYLADLAASRGWRFATLDTGIKHPMVDLIPEISGN